ncbi:hypothetical protein Tco_1417450 [Tanacetum coccineum]
MANQEQNPPQQEQPFVAAKQVSFNLEDIILNTNNEVALLHPEHTNKDFFKCVFDFISKFCLREPFTGSPNVYKEYLAEFWYSAKALENSKVSFSILTGGIYGEVGVNTFRNAIGAYYLPHSSEYVAPPSIDIVSLANGINIDYASIFWKDIIIKLNKRHREKVVPYTIFLYLLMMHKMKEGYGDGKVTPYPTQVFNVNNWALKPNQPKEPLFTDHMLAICNAAEPVHSTSSRQPFVSNKEAKKCGSSKEPTSSKTGHLKRKKESSSAMGSNPSQTSASTPVVVEMHKEDHQEIGGPTSLGVTSEARANPQLSSGCDASADSIAEADPRLSAPNDSIPQQQGMDERTKNTSFNHISAGTDPHVLAEQTQSVSKGLKTVLSQPTTGKGTSFKDLDSPEDDHVIVVDDSNEDEEDEVHTTTNVETKDTSVPKSSSPSSPTTELKDLPSKFNELNKEVKGLKKQVHELEIELLGDLKEIPTKLEDFTKTVASVQAKLKTLDALPSLLLNVTKALNKFAQVLDSASSKAGDQSVPSTGQANTMSVEGGKNTNQSTTS